MAIESASFVSQLVSTNPAGGDNISSADDHLRLVKSTLVNTFPELRGEVSATAGEMNYLRGVNDFIQDQLDLIDSGQSVLSANLSLQIHVTSAALQTSIHDLSQTLQTMIDAGGGSAASGLATLSATLNTQIQATSAALSTTIHDVSGALDTKIEANVATLSATLNTQIQATSAALSTQIHNLSASLNAQIQGSSAALSVAIGALSANLDTKIETEISDRQTTSANLDTKIESLSSTLQTAITSLSSTLQTQIESHGVPTGAVFWFAAVTAPSGFLECNGTAVSRTTYAGIFAITGVTFGSGNGSSTFNLPNLCGEFIRGWDNSRGVDSGRVFGSNQVQDIQSHYHSFGIHTAVADGNYPYTAIGAQVGTGSTDPAGGTETRPRNVALLPCIKT